MMKTLSIREMRASLAQLDKLVNAERELVVTRHGKAIARIVPVEARRQMTPRANLRRSMPQVSASEDLVRQDRDGR